MNSQIIGNQRIKLYINYIEQIRTVVWKELTSKMVNARAEEDAVIEPPIKIVGEEENM